MRRRQTAGPDMARQSIPTPSAKRCPSMRAGTWLRKHRRNRESQLRTTALSQPPHRCSAKRLAIDRSSVEALPLQTDSASQRTAAATFMLCIRYLASGSRALRHRGAGAPRLGQRASRQEQPAAPVRLATRDCGANQPREHARRRPASASPFRGCASRARRARAIHPVCGCNSKTYSSDCFRRAQKIAQICTMASAEAARRDWTGGPLFRHIIAYNLQPSCFASRSGNCRRRERRGKEDIDHVGELDLPRALSPWAREEGDASQAGAD